MVGKMIGMLPEVTYRGRGERERGRTKKKPMEEEWTGVKTREEMRRT